MEDGRFSRIGSDAMAEYLYDDDSETLHVAKAVAKRCEKSGKFSITYQSISR